MQTKKKEHPSGPLKQSAEVWQTVQIGKYHIQMTSIISGILLIGVILSACIIIIGLIMLPFRPGGLTTGRIENFPHTIPTLWAGLLALRPQAVIELGAVILILTPFLRVVASVVTFALERDRKYVIITLIVLIILIISFFLGKAGA